MGYNIFYTDPNVRNEVYDGAGVNRNDVVSEQRQKRENPDQAEMQDLYENVSKLFEIPQTAAALLTANGMFLKYAGPSLRKNFLLAKIAVNSNGNALRFVHPDLLMSDPNVVADLIYEDNVGYPCEAFLEVCKDRNYIKAVGAELVSRNRTMENWVFEHLFRMDQNMINEYNEVYSRRGI